MHTWNGCSVPIMWIFREPLIQCSSKGSLKKGQGIKWKDFHGLKINRKGKQRNKLTAPTAEISKDVCLVQAIQTEIKLTRSLLLGRLHGRTGQKPVQSCMVPREWKRRMWVGRSPPGAAGAPRLCVQTLGTALLEWWTAVWQGKWEWSTQTEKCVFYGLSLTVTQNIFRETCWKETCLFCIWSGILFVCYSPSYV